MHKVTKVLLGKEQQEFASVPFSRRSQMERCLIFNDGQKATLSVAQAEENASWLMRRLRREHYDQDGMRKAFSLQQVAVFKR